MMNLATLTAVFPCSGLKAEGLLAPLFLLKIQKTCRC